MAFSKGLPDRPDGMLYRQHQSPREDAPFPATTFPSPLSPLRNLSLAATGEGRGSLQRRFTTNALPTLSPIAQQRRQAAEPAPTTYKQAMPSERKARQYEELLAQQRRIQAQMAMIDPETRREVEEHMILERDITMFTAGHQSEPTTPPDYYNSLHRIGSNRISNASLASPPGFPNRLSQPGSQLSSPQSAFVRPFTSHTHSASIPSRSVPASRRGSDEDEDDYAQGFVDLNHRPAANVNRNSMPVKMADLSTMLGSVNTTGFLFGDEDEHKSIRQVQQQAASPDAKNYLQLHANNDKFPILVRREGDGNVQFSASSAAGTLAQAAASENQPTNDRATISLHRQSLPPSAIRQPGLGEAPMSPLNGILNDLGAKSSAANRRSLEVKFSGLASPKRPGLLASPKHVGANGIPKLQSSYSTNDIPTLKSVNANNSPSANPGPVMNPQMGYNSPAQQTSAMSNGQHTPVYQAQTLQSDTVNSDEMTPGLLAQRSALQASAAPFGPSITSPAMDNNNNNNNNGPTVSYGTSAYYGGYGMNMLSHGLGNMYINNNHNNQGGQWAGQMNGYQNGYGGYQQQPPQQNSGRFNDSQSRVMQQRRSQNGDDNSRYANIKLESLLGEIYGLCKDQHGCRYLQKKLEEGSAENIRLVFEETAPHMIELMTDPFGNYLCQKLLEYADNDQRTVLIRSAAPSMVKIALNQHGTRALQKMIEFVSTDEQIQIITEALRFEVVPLIQDLNGNHVIQKCLNHLSPENAQFIFDAVGTNCVTVGTHRHGCCVLQRCIDHASGLQKAQLVQYITMNAYTLVQDPFGNYVVQYILDLGEPAFSKPLSESFYGHVATLSRQKFSSNVIEKSIRTADDSVRRALVDEIMNPVNLEKLLRDSYANYVIQTAMDYADADTKDRLINNIRPILPAIRHTPYGRRISGKIQEYDARMNGGVNGPLGLVMPGATMSPSQLTSPPYGSGGSGHMSGYSSPLSHSGSYSAAGMGSPTPNRNHASLNMLSQPGQQSNGFPQVFSPNGRASRPAGMGHY